MTTTLAACVAVSAGIAIALMENRQALSPHAALQLRDAVLVTGAALALGAGLLHLTAWRVDGRASRLRTGMALVVFGLFTTVTAFFGRLFHADQASVVLCPLTALIGSAVVIAIGSCSIERIAPIARRPGFLALSSIGVTVVAVLLPAAAHVLLPEISVLSETTQVTIELTTACLWLAAAGIHHRKGDSQESPQHTATSSVLATLGGVWFFRAVAAAGALDAWSIAAVTLLAATAITVVTMAMIEVASLTDAGNERLDSTEQALTEVAQAFATLDRERRNFAHDARNVILALQAASTTLAEHGDRLDAAVRQQLRRAIVDELGQLHQMLTSPTGHGQEVDVAEVIRTVVATERMNGLDVQLDLEPCRARGGAQDLSRVLRNLLVNAREHAPRSPVVVRAGDHGGSVRITVEDRGPGVPAQLRRTLFERGVTTKRDGGTGLGLNVSRALVREHGGDLRFVEGAGGGACFELTLPSARTVTPGHAAAGSGSTLTLVRPLPAQSRRSA